MSSTDFKGRACEHNITYAATSPQPSRPVTPPPPPRPTGTPPPGRALMSRRQRRGFIGAITAGTVLVVSALIAIAATSPMVLTQDLQVWMAFGFLATFGIGQTLTGGQRHRRRT